MELPLQSSVGISACHIFGAVKGKKGSSKSLHYGSLINNIQAAIQKCMQSDELMHKERGTKYLFTGSLLSNRIQGLFKERNLPSTHQSTTNMLSL
jgi:hypothetical protein